MIYKEHLEENYLNLNVFNPVIKYSKQYKRFITGDLGKAVQNPIVYWAIDVRNTQNAPTILKLEICYV